MNTLSLKPTHKSILSYYAQLRNLGELKAVNEGSLSPVFADLLKHCSRQFDWTLVEQYAIKRNGKTIRADGAMIDKFNLVRGIWEAKDSGDDLKREIKKKFDASYPTENILFQAPDHIVIFQNGREVFNDPIKNPQFLIRALKIFFGAPAARIPAMEKGGRGLQRPGAGDRPAAAEQIETERGRNKTFKKAFTDFYELCRETINPELSLQAVEEMLIQHILTERIFRNVLKTLISSRATSSPARSRMSSKP